MRPRSMSQMRNYRSLPEGAPNGSIDPYRAFPFAPATEGMPQKAAEGAKGGLRHRKDIRVRRAMSLNETLRG
jgi:hypothetical protein